MEVFSIDPFLSQASLNENHYIFEERDGTVTFASDSVDCKVSARINWLPSPQAELICEFDRALFEALHEQAYASLNVSELSEDIENLVISSANIELLQEKSQCVFTLGSTPQTIHFVRPCSFAVVHVVNFKKTLSTSWTLEDSDWKISFRDAFETSTAKKEAYRTLKAKGGFSFTHYGILQRKGGENFTPSDAEQILEILRRFLTFSNGSWCAPSFAIGFDESSDIVWQQWGFGREKSFGSGLRNWFHPHHSDELEMVFRGFSELCKTPEWNTLIKHLIYWYNVANQRGIGQDALIVLIQAALEELCWFALPDEMQKSEMHEQLRELIKSLKIPPSIPDSLGALQAAASAIKRKHGQNIDGPKLFTEARNNVVHPKPKRVASHMKGNTLFECYLLGMWYLEMWLLKQSGFEGMYSNRCLYGGFDDARLVPWAS